MKPLNQHYPSRVYQQRYTLRQAEVARLKRLIEECGMIKNYILENKRFNKEIKEMGLKYKTPKEIAREEENYFALCGRYQYTDYYNVSNANYCRKRLLDARSWLATNPQNTARQREVAFLEKELAEYENGVISSKNTDLLDAIKYAASQSSEGGNVDCCIVEGKCKTRHAVRVRGAWSNISRPDEFQSFLEASDLQVVSLKVENVDPEKRYWLHNEKVKNKKTERIGWPYTGENANPDAVKVLDNICNKDGTTVVARISDGDDVYEVTWQGDCRKLRDEEIKSFMTEKRNQKRVAAEVSAIRAREQAEKATAKQASDNCWINQNGHWLGWIIMIGFAIWFIGLVISNMP